MGTYYAIVGLITTICVVGFIVWMIYEIKHAPTIKDDVFSVATFHNEIGKLYKDEEVQDNESSSVC